MSEAAELFTVDPLTTEEVPVSEVVRVFPSPRERKEQMLNYVTFLNRPQGASAEEILEKMPLNLRLEFDHFFENPTPGVSSFIKKDERTYTREDGYARTEQVFGAGSVEEMKKAFMEDPQNMLCFVEFSVTAQLARVRV